jgi:hypothetical protein
LALGGAAEEAVSHCEAAIALYGGMAAADPKNVQAFEDLASVESTLSVALDLAHLPRAAFEHQEKARQLFATAMSRDPDAADLAQANSASLMELAKLRQQLHIPGAGEAAAIAVGNLKSLATRSPQSREIGAALQRAEELYASLR